MTFTFFTKDPKKAATGAKVVAGGQSVVTAGTFGGCVVAIVTTFIDGVAAYVFGGLVGGAVLVGTTLVSNEETNELAADLPVSVGEAAKLTKSVEEASDDQSMAEVTAVDDSVLATTTITSDEEIDDLSDDSTVSDGVTANKLIPDSNVAPANKKKKFSLKAEIIAAFSMFVTIVGFVAKPLIWLADTLTAGITSLVCGVVVYCANKFRNRFHKALGSLSQEIIASPIARERWDALSDDLKDRIIKLENLRKEKLYNFGLATIFGGVTGTAIYAILKFSAILALFSFPPVGLAVAIVMSCIVGISAAYTYYKQRMHEVKAGANKLMNKLRVAIGLAPKLDDTTKSTNSAFLMVSSTILGILSLITSPIVTAVKAVVAIVVTAFVAAIAYFGALFQIKRRAATREETIAEAVGVVEKHKKAEVNKVDKIEPQETKTITPVVSPASGKRYGSFFDFEHGIEEKKSSPRPEPLCFSAMKM